MREIADELPTSLKGIRYLLYFYIVFLTGTTEFKDKSCVLFIEKNNETNNNNWIADSNQTFE